MEQRRLRLGDILDDYCPRERRVTNHVIVAMIEDDVKQTRCSTCDADHEYKQARVPSARRKKDAIAVAAEVVAEAPRARRPGAVEPAETHDAPVVVESLEVTLAAEAGPAVDDALVPDALVPDQEREDDGPVHRRLIRATLPRPEGQALERKEMDFTVRQQQGGRGSEADGNRPTHGQNRHRRPQRPGGDRPGDVRFGGSPPGNNPRGGPRHNRGGQSPQGQPGGNPGGPRSAGPGGGEGRFRRRRGR
jgi:hypothetical protein